MQLMREGLYLVLIVSAPAIAASLIVGLIVSMLQATTQLQDHTLTFVPKLVAVLAALAISGPWIGAQLLKFTKAVYIAFPSIR
ncbi:MAG: type III secretion system export apparatus subunit SctS [Deltaproteobacteria bacterium]|nr:type III secretion system export apparatus subunit SctS [Deltaproteobacteria bacterium]